MTKITRRAARSTGGHDIKINGQLVNIYLAEIVYKCAECFGDCQRIGMGLKCQANHDHRGFIHRDEAQELQDKQIINVESLGEFYTIENGKVVIKNGD